MRNFICDLPTLNSERLSELYVLDKYEKPTDMEQIIHGIAFVGELINRLKKVEDKVLMRQVLINTINKNCGENDTPDTNE